MKFRKKPVVIDAIKWDGENLIEVVQFTGQKASPTSPRWDDYVDIVKKNGFTIHTLEGGMLASIGDYIIKGLHGECYPCKPDIFHKTYESIDEEG